MPKRTHGHDILFDNIQLRLIDASVQVGHALDKGISNQARSGYFRCAIILICTCVEGLLFHIMSDVIGDDYLKMDYRFTDSHQIPKKYSDKKLYILIKEEKPVYLSKKTDFFDLIEYCKKHEIFQVEWIEKIDKVRILRNKIHIQSLTTKDRGYTKKKLEEVSDVLVFLLMYVRKI